VLAAVEDSAERGSVWTDIQTGGAA
jgi:hypothetical protein